MFSRQLNVMLIKGSGARLTGMAVAVRVPYELDNVCVCLCSIHANIPRLLQTC